MGEKDPLVRFRKFLENKGLWNEDKEMKLLNVQKLILKQQLKRLITLKTNCYFSMEIMYEDMPSKLSRTI